MLKFRSILTSYIRSTLFFIPNNFTAFFTSKINTFMEFIIIAAASHRANFSASSTTRDSCIFVTSRFIKNCINFKINCYSISFFCRI